MSTIKFQIKKKKLADLSDCAIKYYFQRKYMAQEKLNKILPLQLLLANCLILSGLIIAADKSFLDSDIDDIPDDIPYNFIKYFQCSKNKVEQVRKLLSLTKD